MSPAEEYRSLADRFRRDEHLDRAELLRLFAHAASNRNYRLLTQVRDAIRSL